MTIIFEARFINASGLKKIVDALKDFEEINLECDEKGISLKVMDKCHVSLADLILDAGYFERYQCAEKCEIGLRIETLSSMIRSAPNEKAITLRKTDDSDRLRIETEEDETTGLSRAADIPLIEIHSEALDLPKSSYEVEVEIPTRLYHVIIKDLAAAGENMTISVTKIRMKFEADGQTGHLENTIYKGQGSFANTQWTFEASSGVTEQSFTSRFLLAFSKACPLSEKVFLSLSTGRPMRLQFPIGDESYLSYYLAPTLD